MVETCAQDDPPKDSISAKQFLGAVVYCDAPVGIKDLAEHQQPWPFGLYLDPVWREGQERGRP
jgi:hypothetical protein